MKRYCKELCSRKKLKIDESTCSNSARINKKPKTKFYVDQVGCSEQVLKDTNCAERSFVKFPLEKAKKIELNGTLESQKAMILLLKGTTIMAIHCVKGWCLGGDTTTTGDDGKVVPSINKLKVAKTDSEFATQMAGEVVVAEIMLREIRAYLDANKGNPGASGFRSIIQGTADNIIKKMCSFINCVGFRYKGKSLLGALVLANRNRKKCLLLVITKQENSRSYYLYGSLQSRVCFGGPQADSLFNKIPPRTLDLVTADVLEAMETAAHGDEHTGGILTICTGSKSLPWSCVYADDFKGLPPERELDNRIETPEEKRKQILGKTINTSKNINKSGRGSSGIRLAEIDGITIHVPVERAGSLTRELLTELVKQGCYGSIEKYPILKDANFSVVPRTQSKMEIHVMDEFPVQIQTPMAMATVTVNDVMTVHMLRQKLRSELERKNCFLEDIDERTLKLVPNDDFLRDDDMMYDLGVRSFPNKHDLLWEATNTVHIDKVQERQKEYIFQML